MNIVKVTIAEATRALTGYIATGELNDIFDPWQSFKEERPKEAVIMLTIFVILLPMAPQAPKSSPKTFQVNMLCLLLASWKMSDLDAAWRTA